ncbi:MAG: lysophospholipid acyltransferase family protein [Gammaproteobacteria bacterium]|jgi:1-acyl-sn-glycerol-3-phosphate acyltransferase
MSSGADQKHLPPRPVLYVRAFLFWIGFAISTMVIASTAFLLLPFSFRVRFAWISQWTHFNLWWLGLTCGLRYRVEGQENLPDRAAVVMAKHQSTWETVALQRFLPPQVWVLKRELLRIPFFGWGLSIVKMIAIDRSAGRGAVEQLVTQGKDRLSQGLWIVIFPEGTRVPPGKRKRYKMGGAVLAVESGAPVVPIAHNAGDFWPKGQFIKKPGTVTVRIGPAIESRDKTPEQLLREVEDWIESQMPQISLTPYADKRKSDADEQAA